MRPEPSREPRDLEADTVLVTVATLRPTAGWLSWLRLIGPQDFTLAPEPD